jgi:hypothetical protein
MPSCFPCATIACTGRRRFPNGSTYFAWFDGDLPRMKIGKSIQPFKRLQCLGVDRAVVIAVDVERDLHALFRDERTGPPSPRGWWQSEWHLGPTEWFAGPNSMTLLGVLSERATHLVPYNYAAAPA